MQITNEIGIFTVTVEPVNNAMTLGGKPIPQYCVWAVSIAPGRMMFKDTRNHSDVYYLQDTDSAMAQYREFVRYATVETEKTLKEGDILIVF